MPFLSATANPLGRQLALAFLENRLSEILAKYGDHGEGTFFFPVKVLLSRVLSTTPSSEKVNDIHKLFYEHNLFKSYKLTYNQIIESIEITEKFLETNKNIALKVLGNILPEKEEL